MRELDVSFDLDLGNGVRLHADMIAATYPGRLRLAVRAANLLGKLRSVDGIGEEEYQRALSEPIVVVGRGQPG
jgi:hypothetical protein